MQLSKIKLARQIRTALTVFLLLAFMAAAMPASAASYVLSNINLNSGVVSFLPLDSSLGYAAVFKTGASPIEFTELTLKLSNEGTLESTANLHIAIYSATGNQDGDDVPQTELYSWDVTQTTTNTCANYTFTPPDRRYFQANEYFAVVVTGKLGVDGAYWCEDDTGTLPSGSATFLNYSLTFDGGSGWATMSAMAPAFTINGIPPTAVKLSSLSAASRAPWTGALAVVGIIAAAGMIVLRKNRK